MCTVRMVPCDARINDDFDKDDDCGDAENIKKKVSVCVKYVPGIPNINL